MPFFVRDLMGYLIYLKHTVGMKIMGKAVKPWGFNRVVF
jgi:hypothetical protein